MSWFVSGEQISYWLRQIIDVRAESRYFAITEFNNLSYHSITEFVFNHLRSDLPFSRKSDRKEEKGVVSFTHEQNIIWSQTELDDIAHEQVIICK